MKVGAMTSLGIDKPHIWRDRRGWWIYRLGVRRGPMAWSEILEQS